jgi:F-type H+-transporting ATPase subunit delta
MVMLDTGTRVGKIYAQALFELADSAGAVDTVKENLDFLAVITAQQRDFAAMLSFPWFPDEDKQLLTNKIFSGRLADLTLDFLMVVIKHDRSGFLPHIAERYNELWEAHYGYCPVSVTLSKQMNDDEIKKLYADIATVIKKRVKLEINIDPSIIGGITIRYGDKVIDNTVRTRLRQVVKATTNPLNK